MRWIGELGRRIAMFVRRGKFDRAMDDEMRLHVELREQEHAANGFPVAEAHMNARRQFGNALALREESRDSWGWAWLEHLAQDLRFAFRMLRKSPGFTAVAVLTLALGIGANTAIFSIIEGVFLRPLPYPNASQIYLVTRSGNAFGGESISEAILVAWHRQEANLFQHFGETRFTGNATLMISGEPENFPAMGMTTDFLEVTGVHPVLGPRFAAEDGVGGGPNVVMLSNSLWHSAFAANPNIVGQNITLNGKPYRVVGVLPAGFTDPTFSPPVPQIWFPLQIPAVSNDPANGGQLCFGILKPGVTVADAEAALTPALSDLRKQFPKMFMPQERARLVPLRVMLNQWAGSEVWLLFGAVGLVLLIACVNVANLTLARSTTRHREMAVRVVIGASRRRIMRQLLTENILLATLGGAAGVLVCYGSFHFIASLIPPDLPHVGAFGIDVRVIAFAFGLSVVTGIVFGLIPALGASRVNLTGSLKDSSAQAGARTGGLRRALAAAEVAISLILVIGAALTLESLARLMLVRPGFDAHNVLTFSVSLPEQKYDTPAKCTLFFNQALSRLASLPGVEEAASIDTLPLVEGSDILFSADSATKPAGQPLDANIRVISPDYFRALRIPLFAGRELNAADNAGSAPVVVINQTMAKLFWPGKNPIGQELWIGKAMGPAFAEPAPRRIVGIVGDVRESSLAEAPGQTMFIPYMQTKFNSMGSFVLRALGASMLQASEIRAALREVDPAQPVTTISTMEQVESASLNDWRFHAILLGIFGALALVIAAAGVYGVISYSVAQRTHEIGVRMALGAQRNGILRLVIGQGLSLAGVGIIAGLAGALALTRLMSNLLYGVSASDPLTFAGVAILLAVVALAACYIPARRAMKVDPMIALRYE